MADDNDPFAKYLLPPPNAAPIGDDPFGKYVSPPATGPSVTQAGIGVAKQFGVGVGQGVIGMAGLPGDVEHGGIDAVGSLIERAYGKEAGDRYRAMAPATSGGMPTSGQLQAGVEKTTGPFRQPQNAGEATAGTVGSFLPQTLATAATGGAGAFTEAGGGLSGVLNAAKMVGSDVFRGAVLPGAASELAGQVSKGGQAEPYMRAFAAIGAGYGGSLLENTATTAQKIKSRLPGTVDPSVIDKAQALMEQSRALPGGGITLTWPEALSKVAGHGVLTPIQRVLENDPKTAGMFQPIMAARPGEVAAVGRANLDTVAPRPSNPSMIGPAAADAATGVLGDIRGAINRATRPMYDSSGQTLVPGNVHDAMMSNPLFADALNEVRSNPAKNSFVVGQSNRSVAVYDAVKQELNERARASAQPTNPYASQAVSSATGTLAARVGGEAGAADNIGAPGTSTYENAVAEQARLRTTYLDPVMNGPVGKIADAPETKRAVAAMFPTAPIEGGEKEIGSAVSALAAKNPDAARALVRAHMASVFDKATADLQGGPNQWGGANYAKALTGSLQQRLNLEAAVKALPGNADGKVWDGITNVLDAMRTTGMRPQPGSMTQFNKLEGDQFSYGGKIASAAKLAGAPEHAINFVGDAIANWQMRGNKTDIAQILTDPKSGPLLRQIAGMPSSSDRAALLMARLFMNSAAAARQTSPQPVQP